MRHSSRIWLVIVAMFVGAGAFAGGTKFVGCSFQFGDPEAANEAIKETALQYAGDTHRSTGTYNLHPHERFQRIHLGHQESSTPADSRHQ